MGDENSVLINTYVHISVYIDVQTIYYLQNFYFQLISYSFLLSLVEIAKLLHALTTAPLEALPLATGVAGVEAWGALLALRGALFILIRVLGALLAAFVLGVGILVELARLALFTRFHVVTLALVLDVHACTTLKMQAFCVNSNINRDIRRNTSRDIRRNVSRGWASSRWSRQ